MKLITNYITSVGGGINLRPKDFKMISSSRNAPKIREIISIKSRIQTVGKISKVGKWIRSNIGKRRAPINAIPIDSWVLEKASDGSSIYRYSSGGRDSLSFSSPKPTGDWRSEAFINDIKEGRSSFRIRQHCSCGASWPRHNRNWKLVQEFKADCLQSLAICSGLS